MVRHFSKSGDFMTYPLGFTVEAVCQGVLRIVVYQGVETAATDIFARTDP